MSSKPLKRNDEDNTSLTEIINHSSSNSDTDATRVINNPQNEKVQEKFNAVFDTPKSEESEDFSKDDFNFDDGATVIAPKSAVHEIGDINLEFDFGSDSEEATKMSIDSHESNDEATVMAKLDDNSLGINLEGDSSFELNTTESSTTLNQKTHTEEHGNLSFNEDATILDFTSSKKLGENTEEEQSSDFFSSSQIKENIEATINDIVRPRLKSNTEEINLNELKNSKKKPEMTEVLEFGKDSSNDFNIDFDISGISSNSAEKIPEEDPLLGQAIVSEFTDKIQPGKLLNSSPTQSSENIFDVSEIPPSINQITAPTKTIPSNDIGNFKAISDDEYVRLQATIRQMREEREELLLKIKEIKVNTKELEQDNLTLRASLDEAKIENSIIRKRFLNESEDYKHRLMLAEERKNMALEQSKQFEKQKEKLEQRVRVDFNQIRQREKELESKLELMAMDVDSQVNSRDQKILELRRKIDSLEFNMENATIREQKSTDDKRRLEDKLNKIMKTLRHSIKNLEEDLDYEIDHKAPLDKTK